MHRSTQLILSCLATIVLCSFSASASTLETQSTHSFVWSAPVNNLSLAIEPAQMRVKSGEFIKMVAAIKNSGPTLRIQRVGAIYDYSFTVVRGDGVTASANAKADRHIWGGSIPDGWNLTPNAVYQTPFYLDSLYDLAPGKYSVVAHTMIKLQGHSDVYADLSSNKVNLEVDP